MHGSWLLPCLANRSHHTKKQLKTTYLGGVPSQPRATRNEVRMLLPFEWEEKGRGERGGEGGREGGYVTLLFAQWVTVLLVC